MVGIKRSDVIVAVIIGEAIAIFSWPILTNLGVPFAGFIRIIVLFAGPLAAVTGLFVASYLSRFWQTLWQLAKFLLVGVLNTFVDLGVLNFLIYASGAASGIMFSVFKSISFVVAVLNSYFWNKFWTFRQEEKMKGDEGERGVVKGREFMQFFLVSLGAILLNVSAASFLVNVIGPKAGFSPALWANVSSLAGTILAFMWNFLGYKFIVFRR
jgi:putative flippase GtrA